MTAQAAGVTRQLLYLHFAGRGDLLLAVTRAVDERVRSAAEQQLVDLAPDARRALVEAVALQGRIKPRIAGVAAALDRLRATDPDAAAAWREREDARYLRAVAVARRLADEGSLRDGLGVDEAGRLLWWATSQRSWSDLVTDAGWTTEQWVSTMTMSLQATLLRQAHHSRRV